MTTKLAKTSPSTLVIQIFLLLYTHVNIEKLESSTEIYKTRRSLQNCWVYPVTMDRPFSNYRSQFINFWQDTFGTKMVMKFIPCWVRLYRSTIIVFSLPVGFSFSIVNLLQPSFSIENDDDVVVTKLSRLPYSLHQSFLDCHYGVFSTATAASYKNYISS